jgi:hypothetical protein
MADNRHPLDRAKRQKDEQNEFERCKSLLGGRLYFRPHWRARHSSCVYGRRFYGYGVFWGRKNGPWPLRRRWDSSDEIVQSSKNRAISSNRLFPRIAHDDLRRFRWAANPYQQRLVLQSSSDSFRPLNYANH